MYSYSDQMPIRKSRKITTLLRFGKEYSISFEVKPTKFTSKWASVIHFTRGGNAANYGDRSPAVWFRPGVNGFHICSAVNGKKNYCRNPSQRFRTGVWISVTITQFKSGSVYLYQIFINNFMVHSTTNKKPQDFKNVKVYVGDPWYNPQQGYIRNLVIRGKNV